jgi:hypothetical protein
LLCRGILNLAASADSQPRMNKIIRTNAVQQAHPRRR